MRDVPVVIVGAGPVGLALAAELGYRSVPVLVLDQGDGSVTFPAGEAIFSRTMEHLRRWGVADQARRDSLPPTDYPHRIVFMTQLAGHLLAEFDTGATNRDPGTFRDLAAEGPAFFSKFSFVPTLRETARRFGADIRYGHEVVSVTQDESGVTARARDTRTDAIHDFHGAFLVSCEGGRSRVRHSLDIPLEGHFAQGQNYAVHFRAPELPGLLDKYAGGPAAQVQTLATAQRPYMTVVNGFDQWRLSVYVERAPAEAEVIRLVRDAVGIDLDVEILSAQPWSGHRVVARSYRAGRVFLAGDAAHLLWPKGGFGANTGIGDAVDLGWKIAGVVQGWGGDALLDSYEAERRPIAVRNVDEAARNFVADQTLIADPMLQEDGPAGDAARRAIAERIVRLRGREFRTMGIQLGYRYRDSPICVGDGTPEPPDEPDRYVPSTWVGCRAPHAWLPDGASLLDHFGPGYTLVVTQSANPEPLQYAADHAGVPLAVLRIPDENIATLYERPLVLVRPDGHVCWRADSAPADPALLIDRVRGWGATRS